MSDISMPPPEPKQKSPDNLLVKCLLTLVAWLGPLPLAVVLLNFWFTHGAPPDQAGADPFQAIRRVVTSPAGSTVEGIMLLSLAPSVAMLMILHRSLPKRIFAVAGLLVIATGELLYLLEMTAR